MTNPTDDIYKATGEDEFDLIRTFNFTGAFFGGGDPVAETGGQFNIDGGPDSPDSPAYTASGIFAGAK